MNVILCEKYLVKWSKIYIFLHEILMDVKYNDPDKEKFLICNKIQIILIRGRCKWERTDTFFFWGVVRYKWHI